jgi:hypothetical protein
VLLENHYAKGDSEEGEKELSPPQKTEINQRQPRRVDDGCQGFDEREKKKAETSLSPPTPSLDLRISGFYPSAL